MWHIASVKHHGGTSRRVHSSRVKRHAGFSHPARFEILEQRLALTAPAGGNAQLGTAADFGTSDLGGFLMAQNGLEPLPGSASEASGNNPAQIALVGVWGTADPSFLRPGYDYLAFNNPSWIPNDRTLTPIPTADNNGLPLNVYQAAGTASGIRNFEIGANTSMAHGTVSPIGRNPGTATRPVPLLPRFAQAIEHPLDEEPITGENSGDKADAPGPRLTEVAALVVDDDTANARQADDDEATLTVASNGASLVDGDSAHLLLNEAAVDQTMAEGDDLRAVAPTAVCEAGAEEVPLTSRGEGTGLDAVAASLALGATLTIERPAIGTSLTELLVRATKKPWPPEKDSHGKRHRTRR